MRNRRTSSTARVPIAVQRHPAAANVALNAYLFHLAPSPNCPHCPVPESVTVPRLLLSCPADQRLVQRLGTARLSLRRLLSAKIDAKPVLDFVRDTGRLPRYAL
ncbi:hypothetical protein B0H17DRAFT_1211394 [Mycena rosella]|uniref:Reverse transcriptase zinc-binding domain-containing protein n=1 Tax=Mycena rosella TaxID=1033263 RepID=A0AAD7CV65_MYCRO|nr:hypothetical protein B0H17DRAFT_1211394 [Mycena rosella]